MSWVVSTPLGSVTTVLQIARSATQVGWADRIVATWGRALVSRNPGFYPASDRIRRPIRCDLGSPRVFEIGLLGKTECGSIREAGRIDATELMSVCGPNLNSWRSFQTERISRGQRPRGDSEVIDLAMAVPRIAKIHLELRENCACRWPICRVAAMVTFLGLALAKSTIRVAAVKHIGVGIVEACVRRRVTNECSSADS